MRKLEDIPKKPVFKVPDGYFDQLPTKIQARMVQENRTASARLVSFSLKFALPAIALVVIGIFWLRPAPSLQDQLDEIDSDQIALFLENTERADLEEAHDPSDWTKVELDQLEDAVYSNMESDIELGEIDLENL